MEVILFKSSGMSLSICQTVTTVEEKQFNNCHDLRNTIQIKGGFHGFELSCSCWIVLMDQSIAAIMEKNFKGGKKTWQSVREVDNERQRVREVDNETILIWAKS
ncbi:hypothetical protein QL285_014801 [Trifolium repens]|nr:hypothetical protein QL285_014801 [Trifolium repens]